ncbi:ATP-binding protein [Candidatus Shapirobacteria bacterium CG08_land_8_20_14_0_20_39_18]|uniref:ATP-binding protein n=1 Tax=Candidatus Shapirobacteria bacterium CG08_land_8_20_14_0_20_39_18 TaxID=1974883 RepID=A0A2M6XC51_9BACT|nr:MAG: ATP-binding protein [Candidatus Shapirobacteria bacterium CG08_land_8_20_14_0_20_39_18]PIY64900.1 MAG: ATP-binding protein [Candidatus Shapirobacteria bacterium CG_4_10_14_0_8_um_filter_39_15]PJE68222.1 MAG: ATP-binding protein [Candidatus Shapirobacteria bacterium CG10_big_fil_rev_8_21_14_0_10_38_8]
MITKFINRKKETSWLEESYKKANSEGQLLIIYGRRRVGKTELVRHFIKNKPHIYYLASRGTSDLHLQTAVNTFTQGFNDTHFSTTAFSTWRDFFDYLGKATKDLKEPMVLVFDEFPFMAQSDEAMSSYFQYGWDMWLKDRKVVMILMGSSISMMYKHTLVYNAPLYGRRTGQWLLEPFTFTDVKNFYPDSPFENTFPLYAISGGIPAYSRVFDGQKDLRQNIINFVLPEGSFLTVEPELLLSEEFEDPRSFIGILKAIGLGRTKFSEIVQAAGVPTTALPGYLKTLIQLRLVKKEVPVTDKLPEKSKKGTYSLSDAFLRFYFSFIFPNLSLAKSPDYNSLFATHGDILTKLVAKFYEDTSDEFIRKAIDENKLPHFENMGRWWNNNTEIDLVGLNEQDNSILFVETKWNSKPIGTEVLNSLKNKSKEVVWGKPGKKEYFGLVAKGGFTHELIKQAKQENVLLIQEDKILK